MREPPPPTGSRHCQSAATSEGPETGERSKEKGYQEPTHSLPPPDPTWKLDSRPKGKLPGPLVLVPQRCRVCLAGSSPVLHLQALYDDPLDSEDTSGQPASLHAEIFADIKGSHSDVIRSSAGSMATSC
ncbi:UNVERIFIED_CONTAM: hypothetical protein FKN15_018609 [Acipenser sinensis]